MIPDVHLGAALRTILSFDAGFHLGLAGMLEIGQLENRNFWVESRDCHGNLLWERDDLPIDEAIAHFLRLRQERELGFDLEGALNSDAGPASPPAQSDTPSS